MNIENQPFPRPDVIYPDSDGMPMADNTRQFRAIVTIQGGLDALFLNDPNVFVAGDLLWYPVEGDNTIRNAPDAMVVFGRPKGDRGSYQQWKEDDIAPQVVFEVLSPGNRAGKMVRKFNFYQRYGVEEYYVYDPDDGSLVGYCRAEDKLQEVPEMVGWVSPRLGVRFELSGTELHLYAPDGSRFATYVELVEQRERERQEKEKERQEKEKERQEKEKERQEKEKERDRAERLAAQLRALGIEPEA